MSIERTPQREKIATVRWHIVYEPVVWEGRIVSDSALSSQIKAARKAIGDNGKAQALIRTGR